MVEILMLVMEENFLVVMGKMLLMVMGVAGVVLDHPQKEVLHIMEEMAAQASSLSGTEEYLPPQHLRARGQTEARVRQERT